MSQHRVGTPTKDMLLATGRLDKAHDDGEETWTSVDVWLCGRQTNVWRVYTDQHGRDHVIPEPDPALTIFGIAL